MTVSARPLVSNQTEENHHRHHADLSFYFAVVKSAHTKKTDKPRETKIILSRWNQEELLPTTT